MTEDLFAYREPAAIGVSFRRSGKIYYFAPGGLMVRQGDSVLAQTERGLDIGEVVFIKYDKPDLEGEKELKPLLRKATREDLQQEEELQIKEREARKLCSQKIEEHGLPMRLIAADYTFDRQRLVFYFSAESRVDFRDLVRDLAELFHTRIELRQVGVRDQAKMIGGLGPCGRPLCCNAWLRNFDPVSIRIAKDQGLSLNPAKISGICDRLMCCLRYEHGIYKELAARLPRVGQVVHTAQGPGEVRSVVLMHERLTVMYPDGTTADLPASKVYATADDVPEPEPEPVPEREWGDDMPPVKLREADQDSEEGRGSRSRRKSKRGGEGVPMTRPKAGAPAPEPRDRGPKPPPAPPPPSAAAGEGEEDEEGAGAKRKRRRRPRRKTKGAEGQAPADNAPAPPPASPADTPAGAEGGASDAKARRRRPRYRTRKKGGGDSPAAEGE
jgi:cell fate regulator YaaT (PSP1 superfamily)